MNTVQLVVEPQLTLDPLPFFRGVECNMCVNIPCKLNNESVILRIMSSQGCLFNMHTSLGPLVLKAAGFKGRLEPDAIGDRQHTAIAVVYRIYLKEVTRAPDRTLSVPALWDEGEEPFDLCAPLAFKDLDMKFFSAVALDYRRVCRGKGLVDFLRDGKLLEVNVNMNEATLVAAPKK